MGTHNQIYDEIIVPEDIKKYIYNWIIKDILKFLGLLVGFTLIELTYIIIFMKEMSTQVKLISFAIGMLIPFAVMHVPFKYLKKNRIGRITRVDINETLKIPLVGVRVHPYPEAPINNIKLHIISNNRENIVINAFSGKAMNAEFLDFFHRDDIVIYLNGVNFVQKLPSKPDDPINCVICGAVQNQERSKCILCGHSLNLIKKGE